MLFAGNVQPNGANLTGGGTGETNPFATPSASSNPYVPFNGQGSGSGALPSLNAAGAVPALVLGALIGVLSVVARL